MAEKTGDRMAAEIVAKARKRIEELRPNAGLVLAPALNDIEDAIVVLEVQVRTLKHERDAMERIQAESLGRLKQRMDELKRGEE